MKHLKKILSLLLTAVMVLAMCIPVMATEGTATTTYTITAPATTHQYEIYQIFTGNLDSEGKLSNIKWGINGNKPTDASVGTSVAKSVIDELTAVNGKSDKEKLAVIKKYAVLSNPVATISNGATYSADAGYYLVKDKDGSLEGTAETYTTYLVNVVGNLTIEPKSEAPSFEKKLKDINDTTDDNYTDWQDAADYDIGDDIPFKLEGTVAGDYEEYSHYYFAFHDVEEKGLTFKPETLEVYIDTTKITSGYTLVTKNSGSIKDGCTFEVIFNDLKKIDSVSAGSKIRVEYKSTLNAQADLGNKGNVNKAKLVFSNNPNSDQVGKPDKPGETPWDNVIVFTYKVVIDKVKEDGKTSLEGAEFTLSKVLKDGSEKAIAVVKNTEGTKFTFSGLDDGNYILRETKTPEGYNTISDITFKVTADHKIEWTKEERTKILTGLTGNKVSGEIEFTPSIKDGSLSAKVVNVSGSTLPSTGGIGTTIFYVVGVVLMLGAGVLLITKRRMSAKH